MGAHYICEHYHDTECAWWARFITIGVNLVFAIARKGMRTEGAVGESLDNQYRASLDVLCQQKATQTHLPKLSPTLEWSTMALKTLAFLPCIHTKRDSTEPDLIHRLIVRGIKADNFTHDIAFNQYSNGGHILHLGNLNESLQTNCSSETTKRASFGQEVLISPPLLKPPQNSVYQIPIRLPLLLVKIGRNERATTIFQNTLGMYRAAAKSIYLSNDPRGPRLWSELRGCRGAWRCWSPKVMIWLLLRIAIYRTFAVSCPSQEF